MTDLERTIRRLARLQKQRGWSDSAIGLTCLRTPNMMARLRLGNVTLRTLRRIDQWLDQQEQQEAA